MKIYSHKKHLEVIFMVACLTATLSFGALSATALEGNGEALHTSSETIGTTGENSTDDALTTQIDGSLPTLDTSDANDEESSDTSEVPSSASTADSSGDTLDSSGDTLGSSGDTLGSSGDTLDSSGDTLDSSSDTLVSSSEVPSAPEMEANIASGPPLQIVSNDTGLALAIDVANANPGEVTTIQIDADFSISAVYTINADAQVLITSMGNSYTITQTTSWRHFIVDSGASLTLSGVTLQGNTSGGGVHNRGTFTLMPGGSIVGCTADDGGGVYSTGTFEMAGGEISGNTADLGGAVYNTGPFKMSGGEISGNTARNGGGVLNEGSFEMTDGDIVGNNALSTANGGGGVFNHVGTSFTMSGGTIADNKSQWCGGGVLNLAYVTFNMKGGTITRNETAQSGGGVYNYNGSAFTMSGESVISYNKTLHTNTSENALGGGVFNLAATFTMRGGTITHNSSVQSGGGVYNLSIFTMSAGEISHNKSPIGGGVVNSGTFKMTGGNISNNTAASYGGGIFNSSDGTLTITGSEVSDNNAVDGGGIYINSSAITLSDSEVSGNTASGNGGGICFTDAEYGYNSGTGNSTATVSGVTFLDNTAATLGTLTDEYRPHYNAMVSNIISLSQPFSTTHIQGFMQYAFNNYDINFTVRQAVPVHYHYVSGATQTQFAILSQLAPAPSPEKSDPSDYPVGTVFGGWWTEQTTGTQWTFTSTLVAGELHLYERTIPEIYNVYYYDNPADTTPQQSREVLLGHSLENLSPYTTPADRVFAGWYDRATGEKWDFVNGTMPARAVHLEAHWANVTTSTPSDGNGGSTDSSSSSRANVPQTGDDTTLALLYAVARIAAVGMIALLFVKKRRCPRPRCRQRR